MHDVSGQNVTEKVPLVTDLVPEAPVPGTGTIVNAKVPLAPVDVIEVIVRVPDPPAGFAAQDCPLAPEMTIRLALVGLVAFTGVVPAAASAPNPNVVVPALFDAAVAKMPL